MSTYLLEAKQLERRFGGGKNLWRKPKPSVVAVRRLDLQVRQGETLGIVGESGCGKSSLARMLVGLDRPSHGTIAIKGKPVENRTSRQRKSMAQLVQYVFQDSMSSLNPRKTIRQALEAPMIHLLGLSAKERAYDLQRLMDAVNLPGEFLQRYPHEFSGGQAQRIGIARALAARPKLLVLDEPVSALDVSIQAQVLNLLHDIKNEYGLTYIFISHDLSVVEAVSDRVMVMYFGSPVELAEADALFKNPQHPYTRLLLDSLPLPGKRGLPSEAATAELPDPLHPPKGCAFASRCKFAMEICRNQKPNLLECSDPSHIASCFLIER